ncbi:MAG TPA: hypothetical protein VHR66_06810 [Gemmataceae bacterium]|jgi:hypothetical protein|nr:hypothetical protein [Gemmataceae bacterium]
MRQHCLRLPIIVMTCGLLAGCHDDGSAASVYPVQGSLVIDDRPAVSARVAFHPIDPSVNAFCPVGIVGPDGSFHLTTRTADDGAPAGDYIVTVIWYKDGVTIDECGCSGVDPLTHDRLHGLYADAATSTLRAKVLPQSNEIRLQGSIGSNGWNLPRRKLAEQEKIVDGPRGEETRRR